MTEYAEVNLRGLWRNAASK